MIEIKGYKPIEQTGGYSLEDLIATERENARLILCFEQIHRIVDEDSYHMGDQIRMLFGWKKKEKE